MQSNIPNGDKNEKLKFFIRLLFSIVIILIGILMASLINVNIVNQIGLAFIVAGVCTIFTEIAFGEYWTGVNKCENIFSYDCGVNLIQDERIGFNGYYTWILDNNKTDIFFAGRSVLHRIKNDLHERKLPSVQKCIVKRMNDGTNFRILFLNPQWELIEKIAAQEGRSTAKELFVDLKTTLEIVDEIWNSLDNDNSYSGSIDIRMYEEISQYAYHSIKNILNNHTEMYVGFYFAKTLGWKSSVFDVKSEKVQKPFEEHFSTIFERSKKLLFYPPGGTKNLREFDKRLFNKLIDNIDEKIK